MPKRHRMLPALILPLLAVLVAVGIPAVRQQRQDRLDRALFRAVQLGESPSGQAGDLPAVCRLLEQGASPNAFTYDWFPPPWYAPLVDNIHFRRPRHPHNPPRRRYALSVAVANDDYPVAKALVAAGASVEVRAGSLHETPLMEAAYGNDVAMAALLLSHGADVRAEGYNGITALGWAVIGSEPNKASSPPPLVCLLLAHGADPNCNARSIGSPIQGAIAAEDWPTVLLMGHYGGDVNARIRTDTASDVAGMTALDYALQDASRSGDYSVVRHLLRAGAVPSSTFDYSSVTNLPPWFQKLLHPQARRWTHTT